MIRAACERMSLPLVTELVTKTGLIHDVVTRAAGYRNYITFPRQPATRLLHQNSRLEGSQAGFELAELGLDWLELVISRAARAFAHHYHQLEALNHSRKDNFQ